MFDKKDLQNAVYQALIDLGGRATIIQVAEHIWNNNKEEIYGSKLEFTWQYDMRWQATNLRRKRLIKDCNESPRSIWEIK